MSGAVSATTLAEISLAATVASAAVSGAGAIAQGNAQAAAAGYNAKIARQNAQLATQNANLAGAEGEQKAGMAGLENQQKVGAIRAAQAANGVDVNTGSAAQVQKSQTELGMLNEMNIRSNAARQAYGYITQAQGYKDQSALDKSSASASRTAGYIGAGTSLLGGAAQASQYGDWLGGKGLGVQESVDTANLPLGQYGPVYEH